MKKINLSEWARLHKVSRERARQFVEEGRIKGAVKKGRSWRIPADSPYPETFLAWQKKYRLRKLKRVSIGPSATLLRGAARFAKTICSESTLIKSPICLKGIKQGLITEIHGRDIPRNTAMLNTFKALYGEKK